MKRQGIGKNSIILFISSAIASIFTYLFYLFMGKLLGPENYSVLGVLLSIFFIFSVTANVISIIIVKYVAYFEAKNQHEKVKSLFQDSLKVVFYGGMLFFLVLLAFSGRIAASLRMPTTVPIILLGLVIWSFSLMTVFFSVINGMQRFISFGAGKIVEAATVFVLGLLFVSAGLGVNGALIALLAGIVLSIPFAGFQLNFLSKVKSAPLGKTDVKEYMILSAICYFAIAVMLNSGLVLAKLYFNDLESGYFVAASLMASIPFFISNSMASAIFPKVSELYSNGKDTLFILKDGLIFTTLPCFIITLAYFLFPGRISHLLFSSEYKISAYIGIYALAMSLLALSGIIVIYNLALKRWRLVYMLIPFTLLQIMLIILFHSTLMQVVLAILISNIALFAALLYMFREELREAMKSRSGYLGYPMRIPFKPQP